MKKLIDPSKQLVSKSTNALVQKSIPSSIVVKQVPKSFDSKYLTLAENNLLPVVQTWVVEMRKLHNIPTSLKIESKIMQYKKVALLEKYLLSSEVNNYNLNPRNITLTMKKLARYHSVNNSLIEKLLDYSKKFTFSSMELKDFCSACRFLVPTFPHFIYDKVLETDLGAFSGNDIALLLHEPVLDDYSSLPKLLTQIFDSISNRKSLQSFTGKDMANILHSFCMYAKKSQSVDLCTIFSNEICSEKRTNMSHFEIEDNFNLFQQHKFKYGSFIKSF
jgi:hypothetical protein